MSTGKLRIDLDALTANWKALDAKTAVETGAVVKADGYGLGSDYVARALYRAGARKFFVATAEEGGKVRQSIGSDASVHVFSGHMAGDTDMIADLRLIPMLNSLDQMTRHFEALPGHPFGIQLDTGMNRLGMEWSEWSAVAPLALEQGPKLVMSHLACADEPDHPMNPYQLAAFRQMTDGITVPRSLAATGGILLGPEYHFDLTRPGIGLYGARPFEDAKPVVHLDLPVIQIRDLDEGEVVGYGNTWQAKRPTRLATISAGYADGILRAISNKVQLFSQGQRVQLVGRVSMDLMTIDVTDLDHQPEYLTLLNDVQGVDDLADIAGTIGYEFLTSLGHRYQRQYQAS